jgi:hypothetical protein
MAEPHQDSTASIVVAFVIVMAATVAVLLISGTIPGYR